MQLPFRRLTIAVAFAALGTSAAPSPASAQGMFDRMKKKAEEAAKRKVEERTEKRAGEATDAAMDKAECKASDRMCKNNDDASASGVAGGAAGTVSAGKPGEGAWKNYDFVPGDRVIFAEDFSRDEVGDFPKRLTFKSGNIEIVEWKDARFLSTNTFASELSIPLPETLPERFTLELDYSAAGGNGMSIYFTDPNQRDGKSYVEMGTWYGGVRGGGIDAIGKPNGDEFKYRDAVFPVRIMVDQKHVKVYMGDSRVANVPNGNLGRGKAIYFVVPGRENRAAMIGNIRVASGGRKLYDALAAKGRVATQGILFATGSDRIAPESTPTLREIGAMLKAHPTLRMMIEGHTDNVGDDDDNTTLSDQRAAAVKAFLVKEHGIAESRLESKGLGASKPAAPNGTAEGRQQNRRVELVKL